MISSIQKISKKTPNKIGKVSRRLSKRTRKKLLNFSKKFLSEQSTFGIDLWSLVGF